MKKFKKVIAFMLAAMMVCALAGCGEAEIVGSLQEPDGEVAFPETLSIFTSKTPSIFNDMKDYNEVYSFQLLEEATGTHIEWLIPPGSGSQEKFNLMVAGGDLTDIIVRDWKTEGIEQYIEDGIIADISPYVKKYMPNLAAYIEEDPERARTFVYDGGKVYGLPHMRSDKKLCVFLGPLARVDWLEKLNIKVPETADELYEALKVIKTSDVNGNGKADEIPFSIASNQIYYFLHMFNTTNGFYLKDGKVTHGYLEPEFEEAVAYLAKLYKEGLLDSDFLLQSRTDMLGKITNNQVAFSFDYQPTQIMTTMAEEDPSFQFKGIPNFKDKRGKSFSLQSHYTSWGGGKMAAITTGCKDPFGAMKWLDFIYGEEGHNIMNFGKEGVTYNVVDGEIKFTDMVENGHKTEEQLTRSQIWGKYFGSYNGYMPVIQDWNSYGQYLSPEGREAVEIWTDSVSDMNLPDLTFGAEAKATISQVYTPIQTYVEENVSKIILGQKDVSELKALREKAKEMNIDAVIEVYQNAYDKYYSKDITLK